MKKLIASMGLVALGMMGFQATSETSKPWSISGTLRAFYDDNITTLPDVILLGLDAEGKVPINPETGMPEDLPEVRKQESFGIAFNPKIEYGMNRDQTELGLSYGFGLRWYDDRDPDAADYSHAISAHLKHSASPDFKFEVSDTLRVAQEPEVMAGTMLRARGEQDYLYNQLGIFATKHFADTFTVHAGYSNMLIEYDDAGFAALLDRIEHTPLVHLKKSLGSETEVLVGYRYKFVDYTAGEIIGNDGSKSEVRNSESHYVYAGVDRIFDPRTAGSLRLGLQQTDFVEADNSASSPFVDANLTYGYAEGSTLQLGIKHERNRTDLAHRYHAPQDERANVGNVILDQAQTVLYGSVRHRLTDRISAQMIAHYINGEYDSSDRGADGATDEYFALGLNLSYRVHERMSVEFGYNFDDYSSGLLSYYRSYDRSRVYLGIQASF